MQTLELAAIRREQNLWPREALDKSLVARFKKLYESSGTDALPPLLVTRGFQLCDGWHRYEGAQQAGLSALPVEFCDLTDPRDIWREALRRSSSSAKPMALKERKAAAVTLIGLFGTGLKDREIGRECALDHETVGALRRALTAGQNPLAGEEKPKSPGTPDRHAKSVIAAADRMWQAHRTGEDDDDPFNQMSYALGRAAIEFGRESESNPVEDLEALANWARAAAKLAEKEQQSGGVLWEQGDEG